MASRCRSCLAHCFACSRANCASLRQRCRCTRKTADLLRRTKEHDAVAFCKHFRAVVARSEKQGWSDKFVKLDQLIQLVLSPDHGATDHKSYEGQEDAQPLLTNSSSVGDSSAVQALLNAIREDLDVVNAFYIATEQTYRERWQQLESYAKDPAHAAKVLQAGMTSLYRGLVLLQNYVDVNQTALHEVLRLYDKVVDGRDMHVRQYVAEHSDFYRRAAGLPDMIFTLEKTFARSFCDGDDVWAKQLLTQGTAPPVQKFRDIFLLGFFNGLALPLMILCIDAFAGRATHLMADENLIYASIPIYRGTGLLILAVWLWGVCIYVYEKFGINHVLILDLNTTSILTHNQLFKTGALLSALWFTSLFFYGAMVRRGLQILPPEVPPLYYHFILVILLLSFVLCPFKIFHRSARFWLMRRIASVMAAPFLHVTTADIIIGDYLTSLVKPLYDLEFMFCIYCTGDFIHDQLQRCQMTNRSYALPIVTSLPLLWRFLQCLRRYYDTRMKFPHLVNAGKYGTSVIAVIIGAAHSDWNSVESGWSVGRVFWLGVLVFSTAYSYVWDIAVDWSLFTRRDGRIVLREWQYGAKWKMAAASFTNLIGRCAWMFTLVVAPMSSQYSNEFLVFLFAFLEVLRRTQWAMIRLENEYTAQYGKFRLMDDVYVPVDLTQPLTYDRSYSENHVA